MVDVIAENIDSFNLKLKTALIIYAGQSEPQHFEKCIEEKLTSFVKKDFKLTCCQSNMIFLSKVDRLNCHEMKNAKILKNYDIIFTTLYAKNFTDQICLKLKKYIESKRIALVFLRGAGNAILKELGFLNVSSLNFGYGSDFCLDNKVLNELKEKSKYLQDFYRKYNFLITDNQKIDNYNLSNIDVSDSFVAQVSFSQIININDWYTIGLLNGKQNIDQQEQQTLTNKKENFCILLHKKYKVLISHWYGFSHGNEFSHDLLSNLLQYLLFEHLEFKNLKTFVQNLYEKYEKCKLIDIQFNCK
ncbi:hypothetical protein ABK040_000993 [Willaertia magna]